MRVMRPFFLLALALAATACAQRGANEHAAEGPGRGSGAVFRDCPDCPEMVVVPAGRFTMGSPASEKSWAALHGGSLESVADESPQH